jgi:hypothetical protein
MLSLATITGFLTRRKFAFPIFLVHPAQERDNRAQNIYNFLFL